MIKVTNTIHQFFPALIERLSRLRMEMDVGATDAWCQKMQAVIDDGGFLKLEHAFGLAGEVYSSLSLVTKKGEVVKISADWL